MSVLLSSFVWVGAFVRVLMRVRMGECVLMLMRVLVGVRNFFCELTTFKNMHLDRRDTAAIDLFYADRRIDRERVHCLSKHAERHARIEQGAEKHIAGDAGKTIKISNAHRLSFQILEGGC